MIKVQDLRIGNLYIGYDSNFDIVDCDFFKMIEDGICIDEIIKSPIQLTEEILIKLGFKKKADFEYRISGLKFGIYKGGPNWYLYIEDIYLGDLIQNVHELQNFIHSFGKELNTAGLI